MYQTDIQQTSKPASHDVRDFKTAKRTNLLVKDESIDEKRREVSDSGSPVVEKPHMKRSAHRDDKPDEGPSLDVRASHSPRRNAPSGKPWTAIPTRSGLR